MREKVLISLIAWVLPTLLLAQNKKDSRENLVYNSSFEEYRECPKKIDALGTLTIVDAWFQPTAGSADYYNICGSKECGVPKNKLGYQSAHRGMGYCGIYCSKTDYREYLQTQLKQPLLAGQTYELTFFVSLSEYSSGCVATIGGLLTKERISDTNRMVLMKKEIKKLSPQISQTIATYYEPQVVNPFDRVITDYRGWTMITGKFVAQGGEEFLTIGNFFPASKSNVQDHDSLTYLLPGAYYYIDDVSLYCLTCGDTTPQLVAAMTDTVTIEQKILGTEAPLQEGNTFILKNIFFDFDKSVVLQQSYNELKGLVQILNKYPKMKIEVGGHTDGRGSIDYNQRLSESRAKAVVDYLISKGIDPARLKYKGYGKTQPIDSNNTDEGRARNRRVEFKILSM